MLNYHFKLVLQQVGVCLPPSDVLSVTDSLQWLLSCFGGGGRLSERGERDRAGHVTTTCQWSCSRPARPGLQLTVPSRHWWGGKFVLGLRMTWHHTGSIWHRREQKGIHCWRYTGDRAAAEVPGGEHWGEEDNLPAGCVRRLVSHASSTSLAEVAAAGLTEQRPLVSPPVARGAEDYRGCQTVRLSDGHQHNNYNWYCLTVFSSARDAPHCVMIIPQSGCEQYFPRPFLLTLTQLGVGDILFILIPRNNYNYNKITIFTWNT